MTDFADEASGEPPLKQIKTEDTDSNGLVIEQEEEMYEEELSALQEQPLTLKAEPE